LTFGRARLRVTWDDRKQPSIDAPVALFYGAGTLYNRDGREHLVKGFPIHIRDDGKRVRLACYFPMPFFRSAKIELVGHDTQAVPEVVWSVRTVQYTDPANHVAYKRLISRAVAGSSTFHRLAMTARAPASWNDCVSPAYS